MPYPDDSYVKIMTCRFCGKKTNTIAFQRRLQPIKGDIYDNEPCEECKERFKTYKYFIGDCGHSGFIKIEALKRASPKEAYDKIEPYKIFRIEKCFACLNNLPISSLETI